MVNVKSWCLSVMNEWADWRALRGTGLAFVLGVLGATGVWANSLDTLATFLKSTQSGRADFTQVVTPPAKVGQTVVRSKTSTGQFSFLRPTRFRFDYIKPFPQVIVADGQTLWLYDADLEQVKGPRLNPSHRGKPGMPFSA